MINVNQATLTDLNALIPLFDGYRIFYGKNSEPESCHTFLKARIENKESVIFIAQMKEIAVGFVQLYPLFSSTRLQTMWLLNDLYVSPEARQKGVASALIEQAQHHSRLTQAAGLLLETEKTNVPGNKLYPKMNFTLDQDHNYYFWETEA